ncbi:galectin-3 isoform X2 [Cynoglossus semilaevis]|uniref:galectin-3 isoform X2 n=1 Tax=Cynoglossus semilaevis TaxID=244447 RepID=UPI000494E98D|nr:galectin-3-like isoform X2 [Cynoglossus semilaevis]
MDLVSSILSTLSLPRISILAPDPSMTPSTPSPPPSPSPSPSPQHVDPLCGSCPSPGSAPQNNCLWPSQTPSAASFPGWPGQPTQPTPCWTGQPNSACWPGTQPTAVSVSAPVSFPAPVQTLSPAPAPATFITPAPVPVPVPAPVPVPSTVPATVPVLAPGSMQSCQPCWPGTQYQPAPTPAPLQTQTPAQVQVPATVLVPTPTTTSVPAASGTIQPHLPGWPSHIGWTGWPGQPGWPGQNSSMMPSHWLPPTSGPLSVPYNLNLSRGVYDKMMMTILGHVKPNAKMFTVNFLRGNDIAFHINPRFNEGGKQVVVRNHKLGERWGSEEREMKGPFPFALGSPFEMKILCTQESFRVAVNNIPLFEFRHRVRELNRIDRINILHDVVLTYVNVETLP